MHEKNPEYNNEKNRSPLSAVNFYKRGRKEAPCVEQREFSLASERGE